MTRNGLSMSDALNMSPRQASAWIYHAEVQRRRELADTTSSVAMASRGDPKELKKTIKELTKDVL